MLTFILSACQVRSFLYKFPTEQHLGWCCTIFILELKSAYAALCAMNFSHPGKSHIPKVTSLSILYGRFSDKLHQHRPTFRANNSHLMLTVANLPHSVYIRFRQILPHNLTNPILIFLSPLSKDIYFIRPQNIPLLNSHFK